MHETAETKRIKSIQQDIATHLKVDIDELLHFFPTTSVAFWRGFKVKDCTWLDVKDAFKEARKARQSDPKPGVSRRDDWRPQDCQKALEILVILPRCYIGNILAN
jgi:hypothetical protein